MFDDDARIRCTVVMARHAYGEGSYRYFADPLPPVVQALREQLYPAMAAIANRWAERLGERRFPDSLEGLLEECAELGQRRPTPLLLRYGPVGYNCLHQDVYGDLTFPLQQSRAMVARPGLGEAVIFSVRHRPHRGARGYRRVQLRHGVSAVHSGSRHVLGIIFHNAR